jgi:hypothetical protein
MQYTYPNTPASVSSWGTATPSSPQQRPPVKTHGSSHSTTPAIWSESSPRPSSTISAHASHGATTPPAAPALRSVPLPTFGEPVSRHSTPIAHFGHAPASFIYSYTGSALHPLLGYSPEPYLHCNIMDPAHGPRRRDRCPLNLSETAFHPAVGQLCLRISAYPFWVIPIANPAGITVGDIISHIKYYFQSPISPQELRSFGSDIEQSTLMQAQSRRARYPGSPHIARGDVLGQRTWIHGLVPSVDGTSYEVLLGITPA